MANDAEVSQYVSERNGLRQWVNRNDDGEQFEVLTELEAIEAVKNAAEVIFDFYWDGRYNATLAKLQEWGSVTFDDEEEFEYLIVDFQIDCNCYSDCCSGIARKNIGVSLASISVVINSDGSWAEMPTYKPSHYLGF